MEPGTISSECVWTKQVSSRYRAAYVPRIRVRAGDASIVREGSGAGESNADSPGQAHEFAAKAAETDATKRALMTFSNAFGLSLYGGATDNKVRAADQTAKGAPAQPSQEPASVSIERTATTAVEEPDTQTKANSEPEAQPKPEDQADASRHSLPVTLPGPDWPNITPLDEAERLSHKCQERIDKCALAPAEPRRIRNSGHLAFVASRPCLICGRNRSHAHHLKFAQPTALGRKVSDEFTVPLCSVHHRELHSNGDERVWWSAQGIDALAIAAQLWSSRGELK